MTSHSPVFGQAQKPKKFKNLIFFSGGLVLGGLLVAAVMITQHKKKAVDISSSVAIPLFTVDGKTYTTANLPGDTKAEYSQLENNIYSVKQNFLSQTALRIALAKDADKTVSDSELPKLVDLLQDSASTPEKMNSLFYTKLQALEAGERVKFFLKAPPTPPLVLNLQGFPTRGNKDAENTFVEVADYLCPHCRESEGIVEKLYADLGSKVKFVQVSYPLAPKGLSGALSRGAFCANAQGNEQFWRYHKLAFAVPFSKAEPSDKGTDPAKEFEKDTIDVAKSAELNIPAFTKCLNSKAASDYISKVQGIFNSSTGFQGTPTFYLNDRLVQVMPMQLESTLRSAIK